MQLGVTCDDSDRDTFPLNVTLFSLSLLEGVSSSRPVAASVVRTYATVSVSWSLVIVRMYIGRLRLAAYSLPRMYIGRLRLAAYSLLRMYIGRLRLAAYSLQDVNG